MAMVASQAPPWIGPITEVTAGRCAVRRLTIKSFNVIASTAAAMRSQRRSTTIRSRWWSRGAPP
jgi:hypothetical protein